MSERVFTVTALIAEINSFLEQVYPGIRVEGEVTNASTSGRGHIYFTLKDDAAALDCVMWASRARRLKFELEDGLAVLALGSLTIYPQRGRFQMVVEDVQPQGVGALQLAFEQLKQKLEAEGLFAAERKQSLPALPNRVGIVTSAAGAALQDMLKVLRRFPNLEITVAPARVQGEGASSEIAASIARLIDAGEVNVIIVGRGGGSLEDLWAFNEEEVARAIAGSPVPVISGVGHEVDFTIADFVADIRATTPTQAAELVVARLEEQRRRLTEAHSLLLRSVDRTLALARTKLLGLEGSSGLARVPQRVRLLRERLRRARRLGPALRRVFTNAAARVDHATRSLERLPTRLAAGSHRQLLSSREEQLVLLITARIGGVRARVDAGERALSHLGPTKVLERGYSITSIEGRTQPLRDAASVRSGQTLVTRLARGEIRSLVRGAAAQPSARPPDTNRQPSLFENTKSRTDENGTRGAKHD
jgi:exodeoxyribonuclease VII large subunit